MVLPTGLRGTNGQVGAPPFSNGPYTWDQNLTLSGTNTLSGATTISGALTLSSTVNNLNLLETEYTASGAISASVSSVALNNTAKLEMTIAAPDAGRFLVIYQKDSGTAGHTVTLTAGTYDGSASVATLNAQNETLVLYGVSATRFVVVENIGSVALA